MLFRQSSNRENNACLLPVALLTVVGVAASAHGCGRIPGLGDPTMASPVRGSGGQRADGGWDARIPTDVADVRRGSGGVGTGGAGGNGGTGGSSSTTSACQGMTVSAATRQPADVLLVLDRSGSMSFSIDENCSCDPSSNPQVVCADTSNCRTRWSSLVGALDSTLTSTPFLHWGLKLFSTPTAGSCAVTDGVEIPIGASTTDAIEARMDATEFGGETPTAAAITAATAYLKGQTDTNSKRGRYGGDREHG